MLSPKELYISYSMNQCYSSLGSSIGYGTDYDLPKLVKFLKHIKYPCIKKALYVDNPQGPKDPNNNNDPKGIKDTGLGKLGIPFKFLTHIDAEALTEIQPTIKSGTSHAIRNACDITRACTIEADKSYEKWEARMATEYIQHFGSNSLVDCLMVLGPDLVSETEATERRATGCGDLTCLANPDGGAVGASFSCQADETVSPPVIKCKSCDKCHTNPITGEPELNDPCCDTSKCVDYINKCCKGPVTDRFDFSYLVPSDDNYFSGSIADGYRTALLKHIGLLKRKSYGGYANFIDNSGSNFYACRDDVFIKYFQSINGYYYTKTADHEADTTYTGEIDRFRTISLINGDTRLNIVKDLLYNGYGVVLMTNVGFPDSRDSSGLSYPDRIWYHTLAIVGYDDTKIEYPECVYVLANSWGNWNSGGSPSWGPLPEGSFLVTESHLLKMTEFNHSPSFINCRSKYCPPPCDDPIVKSQYAGCTEDTNCVPFECSSKQRAFGILFGLSTEDGFPARKLEYKQFYPISNFRAKDTSSELYFSP